MLFFQIHPLIVFFMYVHAQMKCRNELLFHSHHNLYIFFLCISNLSHVTIELYAISSIYSLNTFFLVYLEHIQYLFSHSQCTILQFLSSHLYD